MSERFEIVVWSFKDGTEEPAEYTVLDNGKDTLIVEDSREALEKAIADGSLASMIEAQ